MKTELIAACGLYCAECARFKAGNCAGCRENIKAKWCKIRICCLEKNIENCAQCNEYSDTRMCKCHNSITGKVFSVLLNSNRHACIDHIRKNGAEQFTVFMTKQKWVSFPRKHKQVVSN